MTARDGLQSEPTLLTAAQKLEVIKSILAIQPHSVEVCSFVREDKVPAMAGSLELCQRMSDDQDVALAKAQGVGFAALVPNLKGFEKLLQSRAVLDTAVVLVSCTDSHSKANVNATVKQSVKNTLDVVRAAKREGVRVRAYASLAFACPFEGAVDPRVVEDVVAAYADAQADVILLADTLGAGTPEQVTDFVRRAQRLGVPASKLGFHFHDSHGRAHLNVAAALAQGVRMFDAAVGGCGGCQFAPGSKGNIATEKLVRVSKPLVPVRVNQAALRQANADLAAKLKRPLDQ